MKWYCIFTSEDSSNYRNGYLNETYDAEEYDLEYILSHAATMSKNYAYLVLVESIINPETHEYSSSKLWEILNPLKKKIVIDPKKKRKQKRIAENQEEVISQMVTFFNESAPVTEPTQQPIEW